MPLRQTKKTKTKIKFIKKEKNGKKNPKNIKIISKLYTIIFKCICNIQPSPLLYDQRGIASVVYSFPGIYYKKHQKLTKMAKNLVFWLDRGFFFYRLSSDQFPTSYLRPTHMFIREQERF